MLATVIVTHDSQKVLPRCLEALDKQTQPVDRIILVDSGSSDTAYLDFLENSEKIQVIRTNNIGFSAANNLACQHVPSSFEFVGFVNPDTFLAAECVANALATLRGNPGAAVVTGKLFWFDIEAGTRTTIIDSTGVHRSWYGRWYDRGQGHEDAGQYGKVEDDIPAACGAMMFCRKQALDGSVLHGKDVFDPDFFMYKEDVELCIRLRKKGWLVHYQPLCIAWHGRGWKSQRRDISRKVRKMAAWNEVLMYKKHPSPYMLWAVFKYLLVRLFNV